MNSEQLSVLFIIIYFFHIYVYMYWYVDECVVNNSSELPAIAAAMPQVEQNLQQAVKKPTYPLANCMLVINVHMYISRCVTLLANLHIYIYMYICVYRKYNT